MPFWTTLPNMDRTLLQAAHRGDPRARDAVLGRWLLDVLSEFFKDDRAGETDDLVQASAAEIIGEFADAPADPAAFRVWVLGRAGTRAKAIKRDIRRKQDRVQHQSPGQSPAESPTAAILRPLLEIGERQLVIDHAERLQPIYRHAILHVLDGGDSESLAASAGVARQTARRRMRKAARLVRRSIKQVNRRTPPRYRTHPPGCE